MDPWANPLNGTVPPYDNVRHITEVQTILETGATFKDECDLITTCEVDFSDVSTRINILGESQLGPKDQTAKTK